MGHSDQYSSRSRAFPNIGIRHQRLVARQRRIHNLCLFSNQTLNNGHKVAHRNRLAASQIEIS